MATDVRASLTRSDIKKHNLFKVFVARILQVRKIAISY